jgi:hypothetical protein
MNAVTSAASAGNSEHGPRVDPEELSPRLKAFYERKLTAATGTFQSLSLRVHRRPGIDFVLGYFVTNESTQTTDVSVLCVSQYSGNCLAKLIMAAAKVGLEEVINVIKKGMVSLKVSVTNVHANDDYFTVEGDGFCGYLFTGTIASYCLGKEVGIMSLNRGIRRDGRKRFVDLFQNHFIVDDNTDMDHVDFHRGKLYEAIDEVQEHADDEQTDLRLGSQSWQSTTFLQALDEQEIVRPFAYVMFEHRSGEEYQLIRGLVGTRAGKSRLKPCPSYSLLRSILSQCADLTTFVGVFRDKHFFFTDKIELGDILAELDSAIENLAIELCRVIEADYSREFSELHDPQFIVLPSPAAEKNTENFGSGEDFVYTPSNSANISLDLSETSGCTTAAGDSSFLSDMSDAELPLGGFLSAGPKESFRYNGRDFFRVQSGDNVEGM